MIFARLKGLKYEHIKKTKGIEEATEYAAKSIYLWSKFTINIIGMNIKVVGKENIPKDACVCRKSYKYIRYSSYILFSK